MFMGVVAPAPMSAAAAPGNEFIVLSYHDVRDSYTDALGRGVLTVETAELMAQFAWLRENGYHPVSLDDIFAAREGRRALPKKAVLLTFDDGYQSMYSRVFPLLKLFDYPAVLAVVGSWMERAPHETVEYGNRALPRKELLSWTQVKEMTDSGLVEIASHSYDLHRGVRANPQGNERPAATTWRYHPANGRYESDETYRQRIRADLRASKESIRRNTGHSPRVVVWPYGAYNSIAVDIARELGMPVTFSLEKGKSNIHELQATKRILIGDGVQLSDFVWLIQHYLQHKPPLRVAHVDLDYVYDPNPAQQEHNLGVLLDRVKRLGVNTVFLQAFADPDGDGNADAVYFPNRHLPMRADLFNRAAWQLRTRVGVDVYAWMPVLAFDLPTGHPAAPPRVEAEAGHGDTADHYRRLSPFHPMTVKVVGEIYEDLGRYADFAGILFHDDAYLTDWEDASPWALRLYSEKWGLPPSVTAIRASEELSTMWSRRKTAALVEFTEVLAAKVRRYRPSIKTARNLYARVVTEPAAQAWFGQSLETALEHYDYTAIMAMPYLEGAGDAEPWLRELIARVASIPGALRRTVFELQTVDWHNDTPLSSEVIVRHMNLLMQHGALSYGYYPDDFLNNHPRLEDVREPLSLRTYPYQE